MKGYLNNLAQRLLNTGNRVEPRLPSLFEPNAERIASYDEEVLTAPARTSLSQTRREETTPARELSQYSAKAIRVDTEIEQPVTLASEDFNIDAEAMVESPSPRSDSVSREQKPEPQITRMKADHDVDLSSSVSSVASIPRKTQTPPAILRPRSTIEADSLRAAQIDSPQARRVVTPDTEAISIEATSIESEPHEDNVESHDDNPEPQSHIAKEPELRRQIETFNVARHLLTNLTSTPWRDTPQYRRRQRRQSLEPIDPEPAINVTIGRVEVRAVPADNRKTNAPRRSESPVMPLEEYLRKQRRGGER